MGVSPLGNRPLVKAAKVGAPLDRRKNVAIDGIRWVAHPVLRY